MLKLKVVNKILSTHTTPWPMCGRFANALRAAEYRAAIQSQVDRINQNNDDQRQAQLEIGATADSYRPSHNVAPQTRSPILRLKDASSSTLLLDTMKWGLVSKHCKVPPTGLDAARSINARDDTILAPRGSIWSPLLPSQRCILFVQGFYEWQHKEKVGSKDEIIAHFIGLDREGKGRKDKDGKEKGMVPMAGLWEKCRFDGDEEDTYSFTIVTTQANKQMHFVSTVAVVGGTQFALSVCCLPCHLSNRNEVKVISRESSFFRNDVFPFGALQL